MRRIGRYQLFDSVGAGPSGTVTRAKIYGVVGFEREFAVKQFYASLTMVPQYAQALSQAARSYGTLEHPRIARMSEYVVTKGQTIAAVEFVPGLDTGRLIAETRLLGKTIPAGAVVALVSQAARTVGYAHGRGLHHLGVCPANVLVTPDGDVKVTDFGLLAATLPSRPAAEERLAKRLRYLAPEQLLGEPTSSATDVFALGALLYELLTLAPAFQGDSAVEVEQAVLGTLPPEPAMPRPIVRVLQRALARSPIERFPDARAFADQLDAALRVAPVPGARVDLAELVQAISKKQADMQEQALSGMVALPTAPFERDDELPTDISGHHGDDTAVEADALQELHTSDLLRVSSSRLTPLPSSNDLTPLPSPFLTPPTLPVVAAMPQVDLTPVGEPAPTQKDVPPAPVLTMAGLAPPPIAVPQGIPLPTKELPSASPSGTLMGMPTLPNAAERLRTPSTPPLERARSQSAPGAVLGRLQAAPFSITEINPHTQNSGSHIQARDDQSVPQIAPDQHTLFPGAEALPAAHASDYDPAFGGETAVVGGRPVSAASSALAATILAADANSPTIQPANVAGQQVFDMSSSGQAPFPAMSQLSEQVARVSAPVKAVAHRGLLWTLIGFLGAAAIIAIGWIAWDVLTDEPEKPVTKRAAASRALPQEPSAPSRPKPPPDAAPATIAVTSGATANGVTSGSVVPPVTPTVPVPASPTAPVPASPTAPVPASPTAPVPASPTAPVPASPTAPVPASPTAPVVAATASAQPAAASEGTLLIESVPPGARVFLNGADQGVTPLSIAATPDRHALALFLANHDLYTAQIDGRGKVSIPLKELTPGGGAGGIKVRCKAKDRYYVYVDGKPSGELCPTERIEVSLGKHVVEIYDLTSEARRQFPVDVVSTDRSLRVRVD